MRTESDMIAKSPVRVMLGNSEYDFHPLTINKARQWRTKLNEVMAEVVGPMQAEESVEALGPALTAAFVKFPDKMLELVLFYKPDLPKDKIEAEATEEQITVAYANIMQFAYPFQVPLKETLRAVRNQ
jgi:hypothetical protein